MAKLKSGTTIAGSTAWHAGNDGASSGLDADLLDGNHASAFATSGHNHDDRYYTETEADGRFLRADTSDSMAGTLTLNSGGTNTYGRIRGYENDNHFISIRGKVTTGTSTLTLTGGHQTTFVEHADAADEGWYFVSKASGNYTELARIDGLSRMYLSSNRVFADNYHPNADKWTTARTHTVTLTGAVTGTASQSVDGTGNKTWTINTTQASTIFNWVLEDGDGTEVNITDGKEVKFVEGSNMDINWTDTSTGSDGDPYDLTFSVSSSPSFSGRVTFGDGGYSIGNEYHTWKRSYVVNNTSPKELLYHDGNSLPNGGAYRFHAHIDGTGTDQSATAVYWNQNGTWKVNVTYQSGTSSNHPEFIIGGSPEKPQIHIDHTSNYTIQVLGERLELSEGTGTDNLAGFGADAFLGSVSGTLRYNNAGSANGYNQGNVVFHDGYHPNADKWTTGRTHTVTLTGAVTGTASQTVDGSGNKTWSIATSYNDNGPNYIDVATGDYGTVKVDDDRGVTWAGYAIRDDWVFMSNGAGTAGLYNDTDNEWHVYMTQNGATDLRHNGTRRLQTESAGVSAESGLRVGATGNPHNSGGLQVTMSNNEKIVLSGSTQPYIRWQEGTTDKAYIQWLTDGYLLFRNQESGNWRFRGSGTTTAIKLRFEASDGDVYGSVYADHNNDIGFLDDDEHWAYRIRTDSLHEWRVNNSVRLTLTSNTLTLDGGTNSTLNVKCDDAGLALIRANGDNQGTGAVEVGQSNSYGGGMSYNGDGSPAFANGETADNITFYNLNNGTRTEVFHYPYNSTTVTFNGAVNIGSDLTLPNKIIHTSDTDTYIQFHASNQWRVVTGGVERLEVNDTQITSNEPIYAPFFKRGTAASLDMDNDGDVDASDALKFLKGEYIGNTDDATVLSANEGSGLWLWDNSVLSEAVSTVNQGAWAVSGKVKTGSTQETYPTHSISGGEAVVAVHCQDFDILYSPDGTSSPVSILKFDGSASKWIWNSDVDHGIAADGVFWENSVAVASNYTITNNKNAMSAGPITIVNGVTVTVGDGETWTVV